MFYTYIFNIVIFDLTMKGNVLYPLIMRSNLTGSFDHMNNVKFNGFFLFNLKFKEHHIFKNRQTLKNSSESSLQAYRL